jgi:hypothetical protein
MECRWCRLLSPVERTDEQLSKTTQPRHRRVLYSGADCCSDLGFRSPSPPRRRRVSDAQLLRPRQGVEVRGRRTRRILRRRRARARGTPRFRWRDLPWWPVFELRVRHRWSAPQAAAWAVGRAPGPVPSTRTLYRFAARIFTERIRSKGIKLTDVQIAWLRRRHLIPFWYDCACQDRTRCPGLPPPHTRRHNRRGAGGRFEADRDRSPRWAGA